MSELEKIAKELFEKTGVAFSFYAENTKPRGAVVCDRHFEGVTDDGSHTFFRFLYRNVGYIGVLNGASAAERNYALLLPSYIESAAEKEAELSKTAALRRILLGEASTIAIHRYATRYSVRGAACFVVLLYIPRLMKEALGLLEQYGGNSLDTVVQMDEKHCVLVKFVEDWENEYRSSVDYAEFLTQSLKEELGVESVASVGPTVREIKDAGVSYVQAENAMRYAEVFEISGKVHSYRDFLLVKILEDIPENKRAEYLTEFTDEHFKEVFEDEEMSETAEAFLQSSLNVSETSRNLYMHRNTLLYRLDKIEKATGLNIRSFSDAVSFRVLMILYKLLGK